MKTSVLWQKYQNSKRLANTTFARYQIVVNRLNEISDEFPLSGIEVNEFIKYLESKYHLNDESLKTAYQVINALGNFQERYYDIKNPCKKAEKIHRKKKSRRYFSPQEIGQIIARCYTDYDRALILTLIDSACRIGELIQLKGSDVLENQIKVVGKTGERTYRLDPRLCIILKDLAGSNESYVFKHIVRNGKRNEPDNNTIFSDEPSTRASLTQRVRNLMIEAGITGKKIGAHTLRHTSASIVGIESGSALIVQSLLQHDDIKTSQIYMHDVQDKLALKYSPLQLLSDKLNAGTDPNIKQHPLMIPEHPQSASTEPVTDAKDNIDVLIESSFQEVPPHISIRPKLDSDDLNLIRRSFIAVSQNGALTDGNSARQLFRRILRRT
jgi:integrase/recombinase XerD